MFRDSGWRRNAALLLILSAPALGCRPEAPRTPEATVSAWVQALRDQDYGRAWEFLSREAKAQVRREDFVAAMKSDPRWAADLIARYGQAPPSQEVHFDIELANGEKLVFWLEEQDFRLDASALDPWPQNTPQAAIASFLSAYEKARFDILLRLVPDQDAEGVTEASLREAWESDQGLEIRALLAEIRVALATRPIEVLGPRASLSYGSESRLTLLFEGGRWKVDDVE